MVMTLSDDQTPLLYRNARKYHRKRRYYVDSGAEVTIKTTESPHDYKRRWRSIRVSYAITYFSATSFTITLPSLWTYLKLLNPQASPSLLGWAVSAFSLGQIVSSPLFGYWANRRRSTREPILVCMVFSCAGYVLYTYLDNFPDHKDVFLIATRALIGFSTGFVGVLRSYISAATTLKERTVTNANLSICGTLGFITGPLLQSAFVLVSYPGPFETSVFHFNMYTAPAFSAALACFINFVILVLIFEEHRINDEDDDEEKSIQSLTEEEQPQVTVDYIAVFSCILLFFIVAFIFQTMQTIGTPLTMHMYGWNKAQVTFVQGINAGGISALAVFVYILLKLATKRIGERALLLFGFIICFLAFFAFLPWGNQLPPLSMTEITYNITDSPRFNTSSGDLTTQPVTDITSASTPVSNNTQEISGCPQNYQWCHSVPVVQLAQYIGGSVLLGVGYPICHVLAFSIYSKVLGSKPQGLWMGYFAASGSAAGVLAPVFITNIYDWYGPRIAFASCCAVLAVTIFFVSLIYQRLIPFAQRQNRSYTSRSRSS